MGDSCAAAELVIKVRLLVLESRRVLPAELIVPPALLTTTSAVKDRGCIKLNSHCLSGNCKKRDCSKSGQYQWFLHHDQMVYEQTNFWTLN